MLIVQFQFSLNKTIGLNSGIDYSIKMKFDWPQCSLTEEAVVRRELAENFCYYNQHYDSVEGAPAPVSVLLVQSTSCANGN